MVCPDFACLCPYPGPDLDLCRGPDPGLFHALTRLVLPLVLVLPLDSPSILQPVELARMHTQQAISAF
jgi:hypothetical protein